VWHIIASIESSRSFCMLFQMLCLIGEAFDGETEEICGAVMNVRMKGDKIAVWTRDATNVDSNMKIG